jgi:hypothetical protein
MKLSLIFFVLALSGCGHNDSSDSGSTQESYKYSLDENGCKTEKTFSAKQTYCDTLENETANNGCALRDREELYKRDCGSDFKETNPPTP